MLVDDYLGMLKLVGHPVSLLSLISQLLLHIMGSLLKPMSFFLLQLHLLILEYLLLLLLLEEQVLSLITVCLASGFLCRQLPVLVLDRLVPLGSFGC